MINLPQEGGFIFIYSADRKIYEFHVNAQVFKTEYNATLEFNTVCYEFKRKNSVHGKCNSTYFVETIEDFENFDENKPKDLKNLKVSFEVHFCEDSFELVRADLFQETDILRRSYERFIALAEFDNSTKPEFLTLNSFLDTFERKKLTKTFSAGNFHVK